MDIGSLSLKISDFTVTTMDNGMVVFFFNCEGWRTICMSREEALELSCRIEQAAQKIKESEDSCKGEGCMNLTNEQVEQILEGAPEGATHVEVIEDEPNEYWMLDSDECLWHWHKNPKDPNRTWRIGIPELPVENIHDLSDLREILTLRQEVEHLKTHQSEVAARAAESFMDNDMRSASLAAGWNTDSSAYEVYQMLGQYANRLRGQSDD